MFPASLGAGCGLLYRKALYGSLLALVMDVGSGQVFEILSLY
jgi:hypothetical protein